MTELLSLLGYQLQNGSWHHPSRKAIFVGDFIDRGPKIREILSIVRPMCEAGHALAVMGNHEFNALAYHTPHPEKDGEYLRKHSTKNTKQHQATLDQVPSDELQNYLEWFRQLPMWLELDGLRIIHACWDADQISIIESALNDHSGVSPEFLFQATSKGSSLYRAIEDILKGKEIDLPEGVSYHDKDGHERTAMRVKWYRAPQDESFASYALTADKGLPTGQVPDTAADSVTPYPVDSDPVFFGHYWLRADRPTILAPNVACVDYSVAKGGSLCAYRWDGEHELVDDKFVAVAASGSNQP